MEHDLGELSAADKIYLEVIENLFSFSETAVKNFNSDASNGDLSIYKLPPEFLEMFLDIPGRRGGFCIVSPSKMVTFFDEDPNLITVIGKIRNKEQGGSRVSAKAIQLFKISFENIEGEFKYKDNTGGALDPGDIVSLVIKWAVT